jgi:hypothetical protein
VDTRGVAFKTALQLPTASVIANFERQYDFYKTAFDEESSNVNKKFPVRTITIFNRLALVLDDDNGKTLLADCNIEVFEGYQSGGLLNQVRPPIVKSYKSLEETLAKTAVPQMLRGEDWENGKGVEVHLSIAAVLDFEEKYGYWPKLHDGEDAEKIVQIAEEISKSRQGLEGGCWSQDVNYGFPSGEARDLDEKRIKRYSRLFATELTGFCAFLGGASAQEVIKKSGKFTPIEQVCRSSCICAVCLFTC